MRKVLLVLIGLMVLLLVWLIALAARNSNPPSGETNPGGLAWSEALAWDFGAGEHPDGWGWGARNQEDGFLELQAGPGETSVYVVPVDHAPDFVLTAEVMLVSDAAGGPTCVHLMTRDIGGTNHLSGVVMCSAVPTMSVYHKVNGRDHLLDIVPTTVALDTGRWHRLRVTATHGSLAILVDGRQVFESAGPYPPGLYGETYVAAEGGNVRVRRIQILEAPPIGAAVPVGTDITGGSPHER